jgi:hypothetical protein
LNMVLNENHIPLAVPTLFKLRINIGRRLTGIPPNERRLSLSGVFGELEGDNVAFPRVGVAVAVDDTDALVEDKSALLCRDNLELWELVESTSKISTCLH